MALSGITFDSEDFEWNRAPLASMEDLSVVNTPIPTPTAGQSPKSRSRWSHRSSSGMTLDNMLGPINELGEDEQEKDEENCTKKPEQKVQQLVNYEHECSPVLGASLASLPSDRSESHGLNAIQLSFGDQTIDNSVEKVQTPENYIGTGRSGEINLGAVHPISHSLSTECSTNNQMEDGSKIIDRNVIDSNICMIKASEKNNTQTASPNMSTSQTDDIIEDPLSHIQWPTSTFQFQGNYPTAISPYSTSATSQNLHQPNNLINYKRRNISSPRWRTCDVIPEEENMQIISSSHYDDQYLDYRRGMANETDSFLLRPRQVQFISPKHKRKQVRPFQIVGTSENVSVNSSDVHRSPRAFVQSKQITSEMASLIRANDGSIDGAKCHLEPKDR